MFNFSTKSQTLESLRPLLRSAIIPRSLSFTANAWGSEKEKILDDITNNFGRESLIFRSSAASEDTQTDSKAGVFESVPFVSANDRAAMTHAVESVLASYIKHSDRFSPEDLVLVQPMILDISMAGVVFTQDLRSGAPYYVINYDDVSGRHDSVTSGSDLTRTLLIHRGYERRLRSPRFTRLLEAVQEIEDVVETTGLDIEFIVNNAEEVYIVQVRPMSVRRNWNRSTVRKVDLALDQTRDFIRTRLRPLPGIAGDRSLFGLMPDWNPVEMLGAAPRPLAVSLYRLLITDSVWAEARAQMGYQNLAGRPLLVELNGRPYIDVRESFNSFLPASLKPPVAEKLVNAWLDQLEAHPELHDKVEFDVAITTHVPGFKELYRQKLDSYGLTNSEKVTLENGFKTVTFGTLAGRGALLTTEMEKTSLLRGSHQIGSNGSSTNCLHHAVYLLWSCKEHGTRPFSVLARCAFIAETLLRSLVSLDVLSGERAQLFRRSIKTVLSYFLEDMRLLRAGDIDRNLFFSRYGHLRPGSYDILSPRYDQRHDLVNAVDEEIAICEEKAFVLTNTERQAIDRVLATDGYPISADELFDYMIKAISGREEAKFRFTRALSQALEEIAQWGEEIVGLNREELSYLRIQDVFASLSTTPLAPWEDILRAKARDNMDDHIVSQAIRLPYLICTPDDVDIVPMHKTRPNFITNATARGRGLYLTGHECTSNLNFKEAIVFIESADPGFDWIFAHPIVGLVTKYGGANSHMAIRCAELSIPAAIGCGEQLFECLKHFQDIILDCGGELLSAHRSPQW